MSHRVLLKGLQSGGLYILDMSNFLVFDTMNNISCNNNHVSHVSLDLAVDSATGHVFDSDSFNMLSISRVNVLPTVNKLENAYDLILILSIS